MATLRDVPQKHKAFFTPQNLLSQDRSKDDLAGHERTRLGRRRMASSFCEQSPGLSVNLTT